MITNHPTEVPTVAFHASKYLISMCVVTTAVPIIALCVQAPYSHSVLVYVSDFGGIAVVCCGLCGLIDMH